MKTETKKIKTLELTYNELEELLSKYIPEKKKIIFVYNDFAENKVKFEFEIKE